jgi:ectoine hydroxylase-related dioxygenase (phytanoyl-CoA dioxygenase family)
VRFLVDVGLVKLAADPDGGSFTPWHNDVGGRPDPPWQPGNSQVSIWIALTDVPPEKGSMRFVAPRFVDDDVRHIASTRSLEESYAEFERRGIICPPLSYQAGDASAHGCSVMHSAPPNLTGDDRFAYVVSMLTADAVYSGRRGFDYIDKVEGLEVGKPFVDTRFPVLA